jgi:hypothetical protein
VSFSIPARTFTVALFGAAAAAGVCRFLNADTTAGAALRVVTATMAVGVLPGALLMLLWRPRPVVTVIEIFGFGMALSFGIVHLLTILAVTTHLAPHIVLAGAGIGLMVVAVIVVRRNAGAVILTLDELIVLVPVLLLGIPLYLQGSPFAVYEDQVLAAIVRRLAALDAPRLDNLYATPGIIYTYPFPGALYFMALIARLGDIDPLFVYHKLRFFWGPAAVVMLYLGARALFGYAAVACAVALAAVVFICTGVFAMLPEFPAWWAQLVPYSYVPDVAMTVLLPALLVMTFEYVQAASSRERHFFLAGAAALILMLTVVHIREIIQFAAYLGCFIVVAATVRRFRGYVAPAATLLGVTLVIAIGYTLLQGAIAPRSNDIIGEERRNLVALASGIPIQSLVLSPAASVLGDFIQDFDQMFAGLIPFFLFAGTIVIVVFRDRPLIWLISSSTVAYLAVMTVPLLAIPYIYLTYFEILHIPVRNVIWFVYLFAGALLYVTVLALAQLRRVRSAEPGLRSFLFVLTGTIGGLLALLATLTINRSVSGYFAPLIAAYVLTFVYGLSGGQTPGRLPFDKAQGTPSASRGVEAFGYRRRAMVTLVALLALVALWPEREAVERSDQVTVRWTTGLPDERRMALEQAFSLMQAERKADAGADENTWNYRLSNVSVDNVRSIVTNRDVVDTHFIDRSTFGVEAQPPPGDHQALGVVYATWLQYPGTILLIGTALLIWAVAFLGPALIAATTDVPVAGSFRAAMGAPFHRYALPFALLLIPFAFWSARPTLSPLDLAPMPPSGRAGTPRVMFEQIPCVTTPPMPARFAEEDVVLPERTTCPPDYSVIDWVRANVAVDAVFAVDRWTPYPPQVFMAPQAVIFPTLEASFIAEDRLFRDYYRLFGDRMSRQHVQPFFNAVETPGERAEFVRTLGVTHVLVSPVHYDELRPVLDRLPEQYALRYDNARWAVYEALPAN